MARGGLKERLAEPVQSTVPFPHGIGGGTLQGYEDGLLGVLGLRPLGKDAGCYLLTYCDSLYFVLSN